MSKTITVKARTIFGAIKYYPACDTSRLLCEIAGTEQVTPSMITICKSNGFEITVAATEARSL